MRLGWYLSDHVSVSSFPSVLQLQWVNLGLYALCMGHHKRRGRRGFGYIYKVILISLSIIIVPPTPIITRVHTLPMIRSKQSSIGKVTGIDAPKAGSTPSKNIA